MKQLLLIAILVATTATAHADDRDKAREAFRLGRQHYALREYQEALAAFKEAYRHYEDPSFLFNIAQCERQLDQRADAIRAYRMYLVNAPDAANRDEVRELIARLEREVEAERATKAPPPPGVQAPSRELQAAPPPSSAAAATPNAASTTASPAAAPSTPALTLSTAPTRADKPAYKKWWVWTLVGVAVAGGAAAGIAVGLTRNNGSAPTATTSFGTASPF